MFYYIVDDDEVFRSMLSQIIEDGDLGEVIGESEDGAFIEADQLNFKKVDILFIDLLMPMRDGIETVRHIASSFTGKIIMISQVESKQLIGEAYTLGVEYYITKPLNKIEVISVVRKVMERIRLERSIHDIQKSLNNVFKWEQPQVLVAPASGSWRSWLPSGPCESNSSSSAAFRAPANSVSTSSVVDLIRREVICLLWRDARNVHRAADTARRRVGAPSARSKLVQSGARNSPANSSGSGTARRVSGSTVTMVTTPSATTVPSLLSIRCARAKLLWPRRCGEVTIRSRSPWWQGWR